jgi:hypothetical protein
LLNFLLKHLQKLKKYLVGPGSFGLNFIAYDAETKSNEKVNLRENDEEADDIEKFFN